MFWRLNLTNPPDDFNVFFARHFYWSIFFLSSLIKTTNSSDRFNLFRLWFEKQLCKSIELKLRRQLTFLSQFPL